MLTSSSIIIIFAEGFTLVLICILIECLEDRPGRLGINKGQEDSEGYIK